MNSLVSQLSTFCSLGPNATMAQHFWQKIFFATRKISSLDMTAKRLALFDNEVS